MKASCLSVLLMTGVAGCFWRDNPTWTGAGDASETVTCGEMDLGEGCPVNLPQVTVVGGMGQIGSVSYAVNSFDLDVFEVTVAAYRDCAARGVCSSPVAQSQDKFCNWTADPGARENFPINCVDWQQAVTFCAWMGRRLPTEGEWVYAAFGPKGQMNPYPWGNQEPVAPGADGGVAQLCWQRVGIGTCQEGSFGATLSGVTIAAGAEDLAGNVWEWTQSQSKTPYASPETPCSLTTDCAIVGGSWQDSSPATFRPDERARDPGASRTSFIGFRCAANSQ